MVYKVIVFVIQQIAIFAGRSDYFVGFVLLRLVYTHGKMGHTIDRVNVPILDLLT